MKTLKYILKRVIIGVLIGVLLLLIKGVLFINVNAEEISLKGSNTITYNPTSNNTENTLQNFAGNRLYSNFCSHCNDADLVINNWRPRTNFWYAKRDLRSNYVAEMNTAFPTNQELINATFWLNGLTTSNNTEYYYSMDKIIIQQDTFTIDNKRQTNFKLEKNHLYTILIGIQKDDDLKFYGNTDTINMNLENTNIILAHSNVNDNSTIDLFNGSDYLDYLSVEWITPNMINKDNLKGSKNEAYIQFNFRVKDLVDDTDLYLYRYEFSSFLGNTLETYTDTPFIFNTNDSQKPFIIYNLSVLQDMEVKISPPTTSYDCVNGFDCVSNKDLDVFKGLEKCDNLDVACHIRNIIDLIKSLFVRLGNFFNTLISNLINLFVPTSSQWDMLFSTISDFFNALLDKLGFVGYPFILFGDIMNRFVDTILNIDDNYIITLPQLKEPFSEQVIYNGGTLDLGYIFHYGLIGNLYSIYYSFISVYIILLFINLLYDSLSAFISGSFQTSSSYTLTELNNFDDNGELISSKTSSTQKTSYFHKGGRL